MIPRSYQDIRLFVEDALRRRDGRDVDPCFQPSECWRQCARHFEYVRSLSDKELRNIRHHTYHLTLDTYLPYIATHEARRREIAHAYASLTRSLGGFQGDEGETGIGIDVEGHRVSRDLIRYLQVALDLVQAGVFSGSGSHRILEIGGGYGGLAAVLRSFNPHVTYVITDLEETLFFQAVHLSNRFGFASVRMVEDGISPADELEEGHFTLLPQHRSRLLASVPVDLVVNQQSMQEMGEPQVRYYCGLIKRISPFFYSCNRQQHDGALASGLETVRGLTDLLDTTFPRIAWQPPEEASTSFGDSVLPRRVYACLPAGSTRH